MWTKTSAVKHRDNMFRLQAPPPPGLMLYRCHYCSQTPGVLLGRPLMLDQTKQIRRCFNHILRVMKWRSDVTIMVAYEVFQLERGRNWDVRTAATDSFFKAPAATEADLCWLKRSSESQSWPLWDNTQLWVLNLHTSLLSLSSLWRLACSSHYLCRRTEPGKCENITPGKDTHIKDFKLSCSFIQ